MACRWFCFRQGWEEVWNEREAMELVGGADSGWVAVRVAWSLGRVNSLWASMVVMCVFSFFVQAASGLTFGVVPFVSKRSMGVISGMTGSGGTVGAVVTQLLLFSGTKNMSTETSMSLMGINQ